jgi:uncharacterized protein (TIGR02246 family)
MNESLESSRAPEPVGAFPHAKRTRLLKPDSMKRLLCALASMLIVTEALAEAGNKEQEVRSVVELFYSDFNRHDWKHAADYTTEDWNHINPAGGWTRGREAVLKELQEVHRTFLKGVSDVVEEMNVRFATPEVAIVTATSRMSTFTTPDGVKHENERHIRTFVVVNRSGRWLIMQDQNTNISS